MKNITQIPPYPLTSSQRKIGFEQQLCPDLPLYNIGGYVNLPGAIDPKLCVSLFVRRRNAAYHWSTHRKHPHPFPGSATPANTGRYSG